MQYLKIDKTLSLSKLASIVGERNVDTVLNANSLDRSVDIGQDFISRAVKLAEDEVVTTYQQKLNIINQFVGDSDLFEKAALSEEHAWATLTYYNSFPDAMRVPEDVHLNPAEGVLGNGEPIPDRVYNACVESLKTTHSIDPSIFAIYNASFSGGSYGIAANPDHAIGTPFQYFKFPWGEVSLYSTLDDKMIYFPVYPKGFEDGYTANYEDMPEMLYQYEPWKVYKSSGPREMSFTFHFHRDMWTGDHRDGYANNVIRRCEANCFPEYDGSLVKVPLVTLYIHGQNLITGVMTSCKKTWERPIGLDGFPLVCELTFSITEVSPEPLNYTTVKNKGLIG